MKSILTLRQMLKRLLVAFDFDHTIIDRNSDIVIRDLITSEKIPPDVKEMYSSDGWTAYMGKIFEMLHKNGVRHEEIQSTVNSIPVTPGMDVLLQSLHKAGCEIIIISDSNSEFIKDWLRSSHLEHTVNEVFTNPAHYDANGCLKIDMYHVQDWCELSTKNLCKGHILESYIQERLNVGITFSHTVYVGDGKNDVCPCLKLSANDLAFPRIGYALEKVITNYPVKASIHPWNTGEDILNVLNVYKSI